VDGVCKPSGCLGACCLTDPSCYSNPAVGYASPGSECLATQDNTGRDHIQLRQQWIRATTPEGNASGLVYGVLAGRTQVPWKKCNQSGAIGSGGYIQIIDFFLGGDKSTHYSTVGYAQYVPGPATPGDTSFTPAVIQDGFCYGEEDYTAPTTDPHDYRLTAADMSDASKFPPGLFNNVQQPDCVGRYFPDQLDQSNCMEKAEPTASGWGGGDCTATTGKAACGAGEAAASTKGYFLITELEQIYASDLQNTLCVTYPGTDPATSKPRLDGDGFYNATDSDCITSKWDPSAADNAGLPKGDWCAATNSPATATCHDAWHSISFHVFAGAKIKMDASGAPSMCKF
jgi:hypothetical protein